MSYTSSAIYLFWPFFKKAFFGKKFSAIIDLTDRCNLNCRHCYHRECRDQTENISADEWAGRFQEYYSLGIRNVLFIGGEPSLRQDILKLSEKYFKFISLISNGQIKIYDNFRHRIHVSLDGLAEEHDAIRGTGTFRKAVENYSNDKRVAVNCILSQKNYRGPGRLKAFIEFVRKMNISGLNICFFVPQINRPDDYKLVLSQKQHEEIGQVLLDELDRPDSIVYTTKAIIKKQIKNDFSHKRCFVRDNHLIYRTDNTLKQCVSETNDCLRCRVKERVWIPVYRPLSWYRQKKAIFLWSFGM